MAESPFDMPKFEVPKMEVPAAFRDFAEKSVVQAKDSYEKWKSAAEESTDMLEDTFAKASKGFSEYGLKVVEIARYNSNASFDLATALFGVKTFSEFVEVSTSHARKHFDAASGHAKELTSLAQKVATDTTEPIKESVTKVFNKAA